MQMRLQLRNPKLYLMIAADACLFTAALAISYFFRFEFHLDQATIAQIKSILIWLIPLKIAGFLAFGLYRGMWRYTSISDLQHLFQATLFSTLLIMAIILYFYRLVGFSRAVFLMDGVLAFLLTGGLRVFIRLCYNGLPRIVPGEASAQRKGPGKRVLIIGAGDAGEKMLREILDNAKLQHEYHVIGFVDDDLYKQGRAVHGIPVLGQVAGLPQIVQEKNVEEVLIAIPSATGAEMRRIVDACKNCHIQYKTLPGIGEIIDGRVSLKVLRDVSYEDLLGRSPVELDIAGIRNYLCGQTVLITGCGGSIGSELCRQLIRFQPRSMILVDAGEANLFHIQMELERELHYREVNAILGNVHDRQLMKCIFQKFHPQVVFHAAAYKHVPMLEANPREAVFNNILGAQVTMELSLEFGVERFVLVSTDKAVRPTNIMGASKRVTELILQALQGYETKFMAVRFGNVVGSSGSVVPMFRKQIEAGGPVTVTHPEMTRYFMTIPEAAQLIIQAGAIGEGGEIFILDMGTPVRIVDMAGDLIRLSGKEPDKDIRIIFTGPRPGEKLYEELITADENVIKTNHKKIMMLKSNGLAGQREGSRNFKECLYDKIQTLYRDAEGNDAQVIRKRLKEIVPEFSDPTEYQVPRARVAQQS